MWHRRVALYPPKCARPAGAHWGLVASFERIFGATILFGTDSLTTNAPEVQRARFSSLREAQICHNRRTGQRLLDEEFENVNVLGDEFYQETLAHPIPTDLRP